MELTDEAWRTLSRLVDEVLDLPEAERSAWLARIDREHVALKPLLADLLADAAIAETGDFLATLPKVAPASQSAEKSASGLGPGATVGPYRLIRELGRGGMASVWLAERVDGLVKRPVALKLPHIAAYEALLADRFVREREILAGLTHPNIARLYDVGVALGRPYLALEYVEGVQITTYCDDRRLPVRGRIGLFLQVLAAVQYAHSRLVIHRDLKPSNMLVTAAGEVRLLDFGIAKLLTEGEGNETDLTLIGGRALTPQYASPEQIAGQAIGTATDAYSLGIVLYELLTGVQPYRLKHDSRGALEEAILSLDPQLPSHAATRSERAAERATTNAKLARALKGDLDTIVLKALKKQPVERYGSVDAFAQDLQRYLTGEPVLARPDSRWYRTLKFLRRNRLPVASISAVFIALIVGFAVALWQANVARNEAHRAQTVQAFLLDIFRTNSDAQPDPVKARQTTARELLDIGARRVDQALQSAPEAQAEVLDTLADMYVAVGLDDEAAQMSLKRLELSKRLYGPDDPKVAAALIAYARSIWPTDRRGEVLPLLNQAQHILDAHPGAPASERAALLLELSRAHMYASQESSLRYATQAVELMRSSDPAAEAMFTGLFLQGWAQYSLGDYDAAQRSFTEAVALATKREPAGLGNVISGRLALAAAKQALVDIAGAESEFRRALEESRQRNGVDHVDTLHVEIRLGAFLYSTSRRTEGRQIIVDTLRKLETQAGATPNLANPVRKVYAASLFNDGRLEEAAPLILANVEANRRVQPPSDILADALYNQAQLLYQLGRYDEALAALDEGLSIWRQINGSTADPANNNRFILLQARVLLASGDAPGAKARLDGVSPPGKSFDRPLREDETRKHIELAEILLQQDRAREASVEAQGALDHIQRSPVRQYFQTLEADAALRLGQAQERGGDPAAASVNLQRALALRTANDSARSPWIAEVQVALAQCLIALGKRDEAADLLRQAKSIQAMHKELGPQYTKPLQALETRIASTH